MIFTIKKIDTLSFNSLSVSEIPLKFFLFNFMSFLILCYSIFKIIISVTSFYFKLVFKTYLNNSSIIIVMAEDLNFIKICTQKSKNK